MAHNEKTRKQATRSLLTIEGKEQMLNECNSSGESIRPMESSSSIRIVKDSYDIIKDLSDSRSSIDPLSSDDVTVRNHITPELLSENEKAQKQQNTKDEGK